MPFSARELSVLAYANGFTLWHYRTADDLAALLARDGSYFAAADELLRPGDQILLSLERGGRSTGSVLGVARVHPGSAVEVEPAGTLDLSAPDGMGQSCLHRSETAAGGDAGGRLRNRGKLSWAGAQTPYITSPMMKA